MNQKYENLQLLYTNTVKTNYAFKTELFLLKNENELLNESMDQRERFYNSRCRQLQLQYDRLQVRYRDLRENYYKEKNDHGDYGFDLTGDVTEEDRKLNGQASHREVSPYKVK
jgi:chaperonin cofactor prefoldin